MNRKLSRHGFILILLALVSGLFVRSMEIPRLGLSAHTIGILSGVLLIAIGAIWKEFSLSRRLRQIMYWSWLYAGYVNWAACLLGAVLGAGKMTPVAADGLTGAAAAEAVVSTLLLSVAIASFISVVISLWGLKNGSTEPGSE